MGEHEIKQLADQIAAANRADGEAYTEALIEIGKTIMRHVMLEPLVIHNTDSWSDEMIEVSV